MKISSKFIVTVCRLQTPTNVICVSVCVSVCPAFTAYNSLTLYRILIKLSENVGILIRLIVSKFHKNRLSFDVIMTSFLFFFTPYTLRNSAQKERKAICKGMKILMRQTVTQARAIFLFSQLDHSSNTRTKTVNNPCEEI